METKQILGSFLDHVLGDKESPKKENNSNLITLFSLILMFVDHPPM